MSNNSQHLLPGTMLSSGRYKILRFIGAGGFGCTYEAEFVPMGSRVALKEFFIASCCNRDTTGGVSVGIVSQSALVGKLQEKFRREAQRLFKMQHPHIVRVNDIFEENGTTYYAMDYIDGSSLQSIIDREGPLPEARALKYIGHVMDALEYVHDKSMLHLDIKPDNIMVDRQDNAILIDFGVSKQYDEAGGHNTSNIMGQTPGYAPLEQVGNNIKRFSPATDIYSLGATLYTLLTGQVPPNCVELTSGEEKLNPLPAGTSPTVHHAIGAMMQPTVSKRPQSIATVRSLLSMPVNPEPVYPPDPDDDVTTIKKKSKKWLWIGIAATLAIGGGAAAFLLTRPEKPQSYNSSFWEDDWEEEDWEDDSNKPTAIPTTKDPIAAHECIDMGTSVMWSPVNLGAYSDSQTGNYYAWGETSPKDEYTEDNCSTYSRSLGNISGDPRYDAAAASWGGDWRMPTSDEWEELMDNCTWEWIPEFGYQVTARNGNVLYLPACGSLNGDSYKLNMGEYGNYWSADPDSDDTYAAIGLGFHSSGQYIFNDSRWAGRSIRPVLSSSWAADSTAYY